MKSHFFSHIIFLMSNSHEQDLHHSTQPPVENLSRGLGRLDELPGFEKIGKGKVRDSFVSDDGLTRVMITSDDLSAFDYKICRVPGKGAVLNELSYWWAQQMGDIVGNQYQEKPPHPNVSVVDNLAMIPVEFVLRSHLAKSSSPTSLYKWYAQGKENPYGITLPEGIPANGAIGEVVLTPTTKSDEHDLPLTEEDARLLVDKEFGDGRYDEIQQKLLAVYKRAQEILDGKGITLADTKFEVGVNSKGEVVLADEILTPDNSRMWEKATYGSAVEQGINPTDFSKEPTRVLLVEKGYTPDGPIPTLTTEEIDAIGNRYRSIYTLITDHELILPEDSSQDIQEQIVEALVPKKQPKLRRTRPE